MHGRYNLKAMLEEIKQDEHQELFAKKRLSQEDIEKIVISQRKTARETKGGTA